MKRRVMAVMLCIVMIIASGCGQEDNSRRRDRDRRDRTEEETGQEDAPTVQVMDQEPEEDSLAIYERFLAGDEPLYFREDCYFYSLYSSSPVEVGRPYEFYEVCNIINRIANHASPVNELSGNISYAYIDCGADGNMELAVYFHDLLDIYNNQDILLILKDMDGKLEVCYKLQCDIDGRQSWQLNSCGVVESFGIVGAGFQYEDMGYVNADGRYERVYSKGIEYLGDFVYLPDGTNYEIPGEVIAIETYDYSEGEEYREIGRIYHYDGTESADIDSLSRDYAAVMEIELHSEEEIRAILADREAVVGLTEEIKSGAVVEWIPVDGKGYDLIYGVEATPGVNDQARAIEAYRRFLSDKGHFKEALSNNTGDGLEVLDGMIDGFFIKDLDQDDIPELLIGMSAMGWGEQDVFIYAFDPESGRVKLSDRFGGLGGGFGCDAEIFEKAVAAYPEFADSFFYTNNYVQQEQGPFRIGCNSAGQLVWFSQGVDLDSHVRICYKYYGEDVEASYYEYGGDFYGEEYITYETSGSKEDAINAMQGYRPFLFYDITEENIDRYVVEDYLRAGMEEYSRQDVLDDINNMQRFYEDIYWQVTITPTGCFAGNDWEYNLDYLAQVHYNNY